MDLDHNNFIMIMKDLDDEVLEKKLINIRIYEKNGVNEIENLSYKECGNSGKNHKLTVNNGNAILN